MESAKYLLLALTLVAGSALAAEIAEMTAECDSCHGPQGVSAHDDVPTIAGQTSAFLAKSLRSFSFWDRPCIKSSYRSGDTSRPRTDMCQITSKLSDDDIEKLGVYYSEQPFVPATQSFDAALALSGATLHEEHCEVCHSEGGKTAGRGPRLAGQWTPYLKATLKFVPTGEHLVSPMMERRIANLSDAEITALMNFYASQQD
jgi:cytochrome c553